MHATKVNGIKVDSIETLPNGIVCLITTCPDYECYASLPGVVKMDGKLFGKTGWNSDNNVAYYKSHTKVALS